MANGRMSPMTDSANEYETRRTEPPVQAAGSQARTTPARRLIMSLMTHNE